MAFGKGRDAGGELPAGINIGDILYWDGSAWVPNNDGPAGGDTLMWDGVKWVAQPAGAVFPGYGPAPPDVAAVGSAGVAATASRSDHTHGAGPGGSLPAALLAGDTLVATGPGATWVPTNNTPIYYVPNGGDDGPDLETLLNTWAGLRRVSLVKGSSYQINTPVDVPSNAYLELNGATVNTNLGLVGSPLNAVFRSNIVIAANTTVAASNTIGTRTISIAALAGLVPGSLMRVAKAGLRAQTYTVISTAGAGPFTITVDRPILLQFDAADVVSRLTSMPQDITIDGGGALITGIADRFIEFAGSRRCQVRDVKGTYTGGANANIGFSYDVGGYENEFKNILFDGGNQMSLGISLESQENSHIVRCTATRVTNWGIPVYDSVECTVFDSRSLANGNGIGFLSDGVGIGCLDCKAIDCYATGNTTDGFATGAGPSHRCTFLGCTGSFNGGHGINIVANSLDTQVTGCLFEGNTTRQAITFAGADRTTFNACHFVGAAGAVNLYVLGQTYLTGCTMTAGNYGVYGDGECHLTGCRINAFTLAAVEVRPNRFCTIHNCDFNAATVALTAITVVTASKCYIDGLTLTGLGAGGTGITVQAGSTLRYHDYDPGAAAVAINPVAGSFVNVGPLVSAGTGAAQAVAWPDIKATDHVNWMRVLNGGAPGLDPTVVVTAGVGFTAAFAAGDTSTYQYRIE